MTVHHDLFFLTNWQYIWPSFELRMQSKSSYYSEMCVLTLYKVCGVCGASKTGVSEPAERELF